MADPIAALEEITANLRSLAITIAAAKSKSIAPAQIQPIASTCARSYFEHVHPQLSLIRNPECKIEQIDLLFQEVLKLGSARRPRDVFAKPIDELCQCLLLATIDLMKARGSARLVLSDTERSILLTLQKMLPASSASYEQALRDISQGNRVSWRGTANELREALREVMDHLAPDDKVLASGIQMEEGAKGPTQKQKVRFILKARRSSGTAVASAETSLDTVDEMVATLARQTYTRTNVSTHSATNAPEIRNLKRYVDALLADLLAIA